MKVSILMNDHASSDDFLAEHGLSLYIETRKHRILFDAGKSAAFAENAQRLGIDLSKVDIAILSHGHYDHGGGFNAFLELNQFAPVYVNKLAFGDYRNGARYIGLDPCLTQSARLVKIDNELVIDDELSLSACHDQPFFYPLAESGLSERINGEDTADCFNHEQYLIINENGKRTVISGCSHKGIMNIVRWFAPDHLIGGFHFMNLDATQDSNPLLEQAAEVLLQEKADYYTCHCTGFAQYEYLKRIMGERIHYLSSGDEVEI